MFQFDPLDVKFALAFLLLCIVTFAAFFAFGGPFLTWYILHGLTG